jgi:hypothetical protein
LQFSISKTNATHSPAFISAGEWATFFIGVVRNAYKVLVGKPERSRSLETPTCRWEDNIRMDLREIVWEGVD